MALGPKGFSVSIIREKPTGGGELWFFFSSPPLVGWMAENIEKTHERERVHSLQVLGGEMK